MTDLQPQSLPPTPVAPSPPGFPPTVIIVHRKERRAKCTVARLRGDSRFLFARHPHRPCDLTNYVRLGIGGPLLSTSDADRGVLLLDGTWRWAEQMEPAYSEIPVRSLPALTTAYPRTSKVFDDPEAGLATIEALFAALHILGRDTTGLLEGYVFGDQFRRLNPQLFDLQPLDRNPLD